MFFALDIVIFPGLAKWFLGVQNRHMRFTCFLRDIISCVFRFTGACQLLLNIFKFCCGRWCCACASLWVRCIYGQCRHFIPGGIPGITTGRAFQLKKRKSTEQSNHVVKLQDTLVFLEFFTSKICTPDNGHRVQHG